LGFDLLIIDILTSCFEPADAHPDLLEPVNARPDLPVLPVRLPADWITAMLILLLIMSHACVALPITYCLLFEPIDARFDSQPPPVKPIVAHSDLPVEPIARPYRHSCRMRTLKSRIPRPINRFADRSDLRPPIDEPTIAHPDLRPRRMRTSQSRILRPTYLPASIPSASFSLTSVSTSASAPTSLIGSGRCLYCGERSCAKRWCVRYRDDLDTGRIRLDARGRICLGHSPAASVVRMRIGTSQRACVLEAEKRVQRLHSLPASATASVDITPVPARAPVSVFSPAAGPALGPALVPFVTPPSLLPTNAVSTSSPSPSPIGSLPSPTCSDLAAKHAEFECDHSLPASSILPADTALPSSPHANPMPSSMPNASDTNFLIKLAPFKDALVCLSPAAFDAVVKVLALPELSGPA
jgi:hypothetical protein